MTDGLRLDPSSLSELEHLGQVLKGADKVVQKNLRSGLRAAVKPATEAVIREGAAGLPARGGLRARVSAGRGGLRADLFGGRSIRLTLTFTDKQRDSLKGLDDGLLRHPVYARAGRSTAWVTQRVSPHRFSQAFLKQRTAVQIRTKAALQQAAAELARKA